MALDKDKDAEAYGRVLNWKFLSAKAALRSDAGQDEKRVVGALANLFGDVGWAGSEGDLGCVAGYAVSYLLGGLIPARDQPTE